MIVLALSLAAALLPASSGGIVWSAGFGRSEIWSDGQAEVSVYDANDVVYGIPRPSRAVLIVVAEDFARDKLVKADRPATESSTRRVLKLNSVRSIPTGVYVYQQMLSVFLGADQMEPVKLTMSSHEWCGNSFVEWRSDNAILSLRSYFESVGDRDVKLAPGAALFYDALPLRLRALDFAKTREGRLSVIDSLFSSAPAPPGIREARLRVSPEGDTYRVEMTRGGQRDLFLFEAAPPHRLRRWERADGGSLTLQESKRFRYWEKNHPGDEALLIRPRTR